MSEWIIETSNDTFEADVIQKSMDRPVVVDFWAPWCQPCKVLMPLLDKLANEYAGRFVLVKVNVDECQPIAQAFGVQSIPFVVSMSQGQPVSQFVGPQSSQPEEELRQWLDTFLPSPADELLNEALGLEESDPAEAEKKLRAALELSPDRDDIRIAHGRLLIAVGNELECREIITKLEARGFLEPEAERLKGQLELLDSAQESGGAQDARAALAANPDDLSLHVKLAEALAADRKYEEACELCLGVIQKDRDGVGASAKEVMVRVLDMAGPQSEFAGTWRRRLATAFY